VTQPSVEKVIRGAYWDFKGAGRPIDKAVVLSDTDARPVDTVLAPMEVLRSRLGDLGIHIGLAYACQHLEAWFFADSRGLREYLCRDLGSIDTSSPDEIQNPKLCLKNLLGDGRVYTQVIAGKIAAALDPDRIAEKSPSFAAFLAAVRNGLPATVT
jgi:hypothetical protein